MATSYMMHGNCNVDEDERKYRNVGTDAGVGWLLEAEGVAKLYCHITGCTSDPIDTFSVCATLDATWIGGWATSH